MSLASLDAEHTRRFYKQTLGWTRPRVSAPPAQAGRWTWLILAAYTWLRLARLHPKSRNPHQQRPKR